MKRLTLLTTATLTALWYRQVRFERRMARRYAQLERDTLRGFQLYEGHYRWAEELVERINKVLGQR